MTDLCYPSCEQPQTRRGQERRLALLICATDLFLERGYDAVSLDDIVHHAGGSKHQFISILAIKKGFSLRSAITAAKSSSKIYAYHTFVMLQT